MSNTNSTSCNIDWDGNLMRFESEPFSRYSSYLNNEDVSRMNVGNSSMVPINTDSGLNSGDFTQFIHGKQAALNDHLIDEFYDDKVRLMLEKCDSGQGFQIITNVDDGFTGFSMAIIQKLDDELSKLSKVVFGVSNSKDHLCFSDLDQRTAHLNQGIFLTEILDYNASYFPLNLPNRNMNLNEKVERVGLALASVSSPIRLPNSGAGLVDVGRLINNTFGCFSISLDRIEVARDLNAIEPIVRPILNLTTMSNIFKVCWSNEFEVQSSFAVLRNMGFQNVNLSNNSKYFTYNDINLSSKVPQISVLHTDCDTHGYIMPIVDAFDNSATANQFNPQYDDTEIDEIKEKLLRLGYNDK